MQKPVKLTNSTKFKECLNSATNLVKILYNIQIYIYVFRFNNKLKAVFLIMNITLF